MKVMLLGGYSRFLNDLRKFVKVDCEFIAIDSTNPDDVVPYIRDVDIVFGSRLTKEMIDEAKNLKLIQVFGAGVREKLLELVKDKNILIANTHGNAMAVAEHAISLILALAKNIIPYDKSLRQGYWMDEKKDLFNIQLKGKTLGIIGLGHVGKLIVKLGKALGMRVIAIKRTKDEKLKEELGLDFLGDKSDLEYILKNSDFLVIAVPRTKETKGLIGLKELKLMKRSAYLINISRGDIVDEKALYTALRAGIIRGAGLDVWYRYPKKAGEKTYPSRYPFHELRNVIMTPHIAWKTKESQEEQLKQVAENINRLALGKPLINIINKELGY